MIPITVSLKDLQSLIGEELGVNEILKLLAMTKCEIKHVKGDLIELMVPLDRPDLFSVEGVSRALRCIMGTYRKPIIDKNEKCICQVYVDSEVLDIRPYIASAVIREVKLSCEALRQMTQLRRKLHETYCRGKLLASIEIHDYNLTTPPLTYSVKGEEDITLKPRGEGRKLRLTEILRREPWKKHAYLLFGYNRLPVMVDSKGEVLSVPPIIESDETKITANSSDILLIVTGINERVVEEALEIVAANLLERGGILKRVEIRYPDTLLITPKMEPREIIIEPQQVEKVLGVKIDLNKLMALLVKSGFEVKSENGKVKVGVPPYRADVIHEIDVIEDIGIVYGFDNIKGGPLSVLAPGKAYPMNKLAMRARRIMTALGFQEIITCVLSDRKDLLNKMLLKEEKIIEVINPIIRKYSAIRNWLMPKLLEFLSNNKHAPYPQKIFEIGEVALICEGDEETGVKCTLKLAAAITDYKAGYGDIQATLFALLENLQIPFKLEPTYHPSFIRGRTAQIRIHNSVVGIIGEIYPEVLENFKLENPVAAFEMDLGKIAACYPQESRK